MAIPSEPRYLAVDADGVPTELRAAAADALAVARRTLGVQPALVWLKPATSAIESLEAAMEEVFWRLRRADGELEIERRGFTDSGPLAGVTMPLHPGPARIFVVADAGPREIFHRVLHEAAHIAGRWTEAEIEAFVSRHCPGCVHCRVS
jgi:hypothetical protein